MPLFSQYHNTVLFDVSTDKDDEDEDVEGADEVKGEEGAWQAWEISNRQFVSAVEASAELIMWKLSRFSCRATSLRKDDRMVKLSLKFKRRKDQRMTFFSFKSSLASVFQQQVDKF